MTGRRTTHRKDGSLNQGVLLAARILVVEDNAILAEEMRDLLDDLGCSVVGPVHTADAAKRLASSEIVEAAVLDINLGGVWGFSHADALIEADIPFIFVSGYAANQVPERFKSVPFLEKPVLPEDLADAIGAAVDTSIAKRRAGFSII